MFHSAVNCTNSTFPHILQEISSGEGYKIEHPERDKVEHIAEIPITKSNGYAIICHHFSRARCAHARLFLDTSRAFLVASSSLHVPACSPPVRAFLSHSLTFSTASRPLQGIFSSFPRASLELQACRSLDFLTTSATPK